MLKLGLRPTIPFLGIFVPNYWVLGLCNVGYEFPYVDLFIAKLRGGLRTLTD
jgi:hypothetical protein